MGSVHLVISIHVSWWAESMLLLFSLLLKLMNGEWAVLLAKRMDQGMVCCVEFCLFCTMFMTPDYTLITIERGNPVAQDPFKMHSSACVFILGRNVWTKRVSIYSNIRARSLFTALSRPLRSASKLPRLYLVVLYNVVNRCGELVNALGNMKNFGCCKFGFFMRWIYFLFSRCPIKPWVSSQPWYIRF